jgi:hypothetical protein
MMGISKPTRRKIRRSDILILGWKKRKIRPGCHKLNTKKWRTFASAPIALLELLFRVFPGQSFNVKAMLQWDLQLCCEFLDTNREIWVKKL